MKEITTRIEKLEDTAKVQMQLMTLAPQIAEGKIFEVIIKQWRARRSIDANSYGHLIWARMGEVLKTTPDEIKYKMNLDYGTPEERNGQPVIMALAKDIDPQAFGLYAKKLGDFTAKRGQEFTQYMIYKPTHLLDTKEMSRLIEGTVNEAKELGIETKTPKEIAEMLLAWESGRGGVK